MLAGLTAAPAFAQDARPAAAQAEAEAAPDTSGEIVVTGSRIDRPGFESPTPLTRIGSEELSVASRANIGAALADLPQFKAGQSPQTSGTNAQAGRFPADLRGLGATRTLVLLDGRRFSSDNDLSTIPSVLVKNVDIVTGGASAAWGSGAVAGVVNIQLDHSLTGIRLGAETGISSRGDSAQYRFEGAAGFDFADGRGHFLIGGEYFQNDGLSTKVSRANTGRWVSLPNPRATPTDPLTYTLTPNVGYANAVVGGIITSGVLRNYGFNPDGTLRLLERGVVNGSNMVGGEAPSDDDLSPLSTPQKRIASMARASYEVVNDLNLIAELRYSRYWGDYTWFGDHNRGNITISRDNAFLRPEIRDQLIAANQTSFTMGRYNSDFAYSTIDLERETIQGTVALEGKFGGGAWRYSAYYSHGESQNNIDTPGFRLTANFANAVDAVISPTTGQAVCRVALTDPSSACVPINLFGNGAPSQAAIDYVTGTPTLRSTSKLDTVGVSLRGEPFSLWAGPVSVAVGIEARRETIDSRAGELDRARAFSTFYFADLEGKDTVKEAFGELLVPLVKDVPVLRNLNFNGAVRVSDYRNSGSIWSWKLGATNEFLPGVIGRVTRSRDIRAPSLSELYTTQTVSYVNVADPVTNQTVSVLINGGGNPQLQPEEADTWTAGVTASPMRGLTASLDYFDITINDVITSVGAQDLVTRCFNGNQDLCARVFRDASGNLVRVQSNSVNLSRYKTNGIDGEIAYTMPLDSSESRNLHFRVIGTWVDSLTTYDGISEVEYVDNTSYAFVNGVPSWRVNGSLGYSDRNLSGLIRARYISPGYYNRNLEITNNRVPAYTYFDLQLTAKIPTGDGRQMEIYGNVSNLLDKDPPIGSLFSPFYDTVGRFMTIGARIKL
ncbi:TonB-dependent receptor plug domain-containing protein [Sphingomonas sp. ac-8]|uniref:TonB-dependent receptor plug domain-containing protein n=1 Tax=Sphingomonas sp. ac-8 TaxID=3242977 RepID=UPI003A813687